jgi:hypothetical protein
MKSIVKPNPDDQSHSCWEEKLTTGAYWTLVSLVAGTVIFGALVLISEYGNVPMGEGMDHIIDGLGKYNILPLITSSTLLFVLAAIGIVVKYNKELAEYFENQNIAQRVGKLEEGPQAHIELPPMHKAVQINNFEASKAAMKKAFQDDDQAVYGKTLGGLTALHLAVVEKHKALEKVQFLMERLNAPISFDDNDNEPLLYMVSSPSFTPDMEVIKYLKKFTTILSKNLDGKTFEDLAKDNHSDWVTKNEAELQELGLIK